MSENDDDAITARPEDKLTNPPHPNDFIDIHVINENHLEMAKTIRLFLQSRFYAERTPRIESLAALPAAKQERIPVHIVILSVDETIDLDLLLSQTKLVYWEGVKIIAHSEYPIALLDILAWDKTLEGVFTGYDFKPLSELVETLAASIPKV